MKMIYALLVSTFFFGSLFSDEPPLQQDDMVVLPIFEIVEVTKENYEEVETSSKPVILDIYAPWCGPCKRLAPIFEELNNEYSAAYQFAKLNADTEEELLDRYQIRSFPTIILIRNGLEVGRIEGFLPKKQITNYITHIFEKE